MSAWGTVNRSYHCHAGIIEARLGYSPEREQRSQVSSRACVQNRNQRGRRGTRRRKASDLNSALCDAEPELLSDVELRRSVQ